MLPTPPASPRLSATCEPKERIGQLLAGQIQLTSILGIGAYGTVYKAQDVITNVEYAVKALNKSGLDSRQLEFQEREIQLHYQASEHHNVVSMVKILDSPDCTFVVLEYCPEGDLFAKITEEHHYVGDDYKAKCVFLQILEAVRHCHSYGIYHRDLKPENILVRDNGWTVKLADFGLASQDSITSDFGCGSTFYMSPECQQPNPSPFACYAAAPNDVWSLGIVLVNLTCGRNPWKRAAIEDSTFKAFMNDRNYLQSILPVSDELNFILQRIFEMDPRRRASLDELYDLVLRCSRFTQEESASSSPPAPCLPVANIAGLPPTPPYTPLQSVMVASMNSVTGLSEIPAMEPLPGQQFPSNSRVYCPERQSGILPPAFFTPPASIPNSPQLSSYIAQSSLSSGQFRDGTLTTPPASNHCSPQSSARLYTTKAVNSSYASQASFFPSVPHWPRCGPFFSNFQVPRSAHLWPCVPAY